MNPGGFRFDAAFLRHGDTADTSAGLISGWRDVGLTATGRLQAAEAGDRLARLGLRGIVTSDLRRARDTAAILARGLHVPVETDARWREQRWGVLEGTPRQTGAQIGDAGAPPGGEALEDLRRRVTEALGDLRPRTLVVTHAGPLRLVREAFGLPPCEATPGDFLDLTRPGPADALPAEIPVEALVLTPGAFVGRVCYVTAPADLDALAEGALVLLQHCDKALAVEAMGRAAATVNLTTALTAHLTHGRHSPRPYAVALGWPRGLPRQGDCVGLRFLRRPPSPRRLPWPDVPPLPAPRASEVGGKAAGLLLLRESGFRVPPFEVIDAPTLEGV